MTPLAHLLSKVSIDKSSGCWNFTGFRLVNGYGRIHDDISYGIPKVLLAHRYSWIVHNGPIPKGMLICHHCDNPACVNPKHLFIGTHSDNMQDMHRKGRGAIRGPMPKTRGEAHWKNKLALRQVREIKARSGEPRKKLAAEFGVTDAYISQIICGRKWSWTCTALTSDFQKNT